MEAIFVTMPESMLFPRGAAHVPRTRAAEDDVVGAPYGRLRLGIRRPSQEMVVLVAEGEVDAGTAPRLAEALGSRLRASLELVVLDLSRLDFLAVAGVQVLLHGHLQAQNTGVTLVIVTGGQRAVERALTACCADQNLSVHPGPVAQLLAGDGGTPIE